jgi:hypothetical protein
LQSAGKLTQKKFFRNDETMKPAGSELCGDGDLCDAGSMNERDENQPGRKYVWPWFFWGAVVLFIALAALWVALAAKKVASERDVNAPLPASSPLR